MNRSDVMMNRADNKMTRFLWIIEIALVSLVAFIYYLNLPVKTSKVLYIPSGSINKIISYLAYRGVDVNRLDSYALRIIGVPQQGWINLGHEELSHADFLHRLATAKAAMTDVTLIPGETTYVFLTQLAEALSLDREKLVDAYSRLTPIEEGAFVPNTYKLPIGITEDALIRLLLAQSMKQMQKFSEKVFGVFNRDKWFQYVTLASVVQKEASDVDDMPLVSSVIHNRLKKGMKLQMDGTLNYGKYSHIAVTARRIREDTTRFNTYKHRGLPHVPVCNVSFDAIKAAIFPAKTEYLYFVKGKHGGHIYTRYYSTHLKNIRNVTK
jgi:UPF0755 protein